MQRAAESFTVKARKIFAGFYSFFLVFVVDFHAKQIYYNESNSINKFFSKRIFRIINAAPRKMFNFRQFCKFSFISFIFVKKPFSGKMYRRI